jgi:hypothetical protein
MNQLVNLRGYKKINGDVMELRRVNRIVVAVKDIEKSKRIYSEVLVVTFHEANWTGEP